MGKATCARQGGRTHPNLLSSLLPLESTGLLLLLLLLFFFFFKYLCIYP